MYIYKYISDYHKSGVMIIRNIFKHFLKPWFKKKKKEEEAASCIQTKTEKYYGSQWDQKLSGNWYSSKYQKIGWIDSKIV